MPSASLSSSSLAFPWAPSTMGFLLMSFLYWCGVVSDRCVSLDGCLCFLSKVDWSFASSLMLTCVARFSGPFSSFHASRALFHFSFLVSLLFSLLIRFLELAFFLFFFLSIAGQQNLLILVALGGTAHFLAFYEYHCTLCPLATRPTTFTQTPNTFQFVHCSTRDRHALSNALEMCFLLEVR